MKNIIKLFIFFFKLPIFITQLFIFYSKSNFSLFNYKIKPMLLDKKKKEPFDPHYLYHTSWAMRVLAKTKPQLHYDFSSDLRFVTMLSAFTKVVQYNLSIPTVKLDNLVFEKKDLTNMPDIKDNSLESISCMHVVEHIGLGRYGDKIDPLGNIKAINELKRVLSKNGNLLFVTPVGKSKIVFNAHRISSYDEVIKQFSGLKLLEFSLIDDNGFYTGIQKKFNIDEVKKNNYACGCFWFSKQ